MARILLVDDEAGLLNVLAYGLGEAGHDVTTAPDGRDAWRQLQSASFALVVSDINMPGLDGFALLRKLRGAGNSVPVILLTSRDNEVDEALGLDLGADDYVGKPFSTRVLIARIAALLRREELRRVDSSGARYSVGRLTLDAERLEVAYDARRVEVTVTDFKLLEALARRPGIVISRTRLLDHMRDDDSVVSDRIVDTYIRRLRRKLEAIDPSFDHIETVTGAGYRWRSP